MEPDQRTLLQRLGTGTCIGACIGALAGLAVGVDCLFANPAIRGPRDELLTLAFFALLFAALSLPLGICAGGGCQLAARRRTRPVASDRALCAGVLIAGLVFAELWDRSFTAQQLLHRAHPTTIEPAKSWLCLGAIALAALAAGAAGAALARALLGGRLRRWLAAAGACAALLLAAALLRPTPDFRPPRYTPEMGAGSAQRVCLVVVDGADWRIARPLIEAGRMPHLAGLIERGVHGALGVSYPSESPHMWTALSTGLEDRFNGLCEFYGYRPPGTAALITRYPGLGTSRRTFFRRGILGLAERGIGSVHFASSAQKRVPELWDYLGAAGKTVAVVGWRFTSPPRPVNGFLLTDAAEPGADPAAELHPPERAALVAGGLDAEVDAQMAAFGDFAPKDPEQARRVARNAGELRANLERDLLYFHTARAVQRELAPDFLAVAHRTVDGLEHLTMLHHVFARAPAGTPVPVHLRGRLTPERIAANADIVSQAYATFDEDLGLLLEGVGDAVVIVVSDHGHDLDGSGHQFGTPGILVMAGGPIARGAVPQGATVFDVLPSVLHLMGLPIPEGLEGRVLLEVLDPAWSGAHPVRTLAPDPAYRGPRAPSAPLGGVREEQLRELEQLGYLE